MNVRCLVVDDSQDFLRAARRVLESGGITVVGATKINFLAEDRLIRRGKVPMTELSGPIFLRWNQVTDINYPTESDIIERMRAEFEARIERSRKRRTLAGRLSASLRAQL